MSERKSDDLPIQGDLLPGGVMKDGHLAIGGKRIAAIFVRAREAFGGENVLVDKGFGGFVRRDLSEG